MTETLIFEMVRARDRRRKPRIHQGMSLRREVEVPVIEERDIFNAFIPGMTQFFEPKMRVAIMNA